MDSLKAQKLNYGDFEEKPDISTKERMPLKANDHVLSELLHGIHKHYPIGLQIARNRYSGYEDLLQRLDQKMEMVESDEATNDWFQLVTDARNTIPNLKIDDLSFHNFPSLKLVINLSEEASAELKERKQISVALSLLTNHYTIFFISNLTYQNLKFGKSNLRLQIVHGEMNASKKELHVFKTIRNLVKNYYPNYNFVDHRLLLSTKISGGLPYGESLDFSDADYSIYSFLFGRELSESPILID